MSDRNFGQASPEAGEYGGRVIGRHRERVDGREVVLFGVQPHIEIRSVVIQFRECVPATRFSVCVLAPESVRSEIWFLHYDWWMADRVWRVITASQGIGMIVTLGPAVVEHFQDRGLGAATEKLFGAAGKKGANGCREVKIILKDHVKSRARANILQLNGSIVPRAEKRFTTSTCE